MLGILAAVKDAYHLTPMLFGSISLKTAPHVWLSEERPVGHRP